jgi:hypothetical protein
MQSLAQINLADTIAIAAAIAGLVGGLAGSVIGFGLVRYEAWIAARGKLMRLVFQTSYELHYPQHHASEKELTEQVLRPKFSELWGCSTEVTTMVCYWNRKAVRKRVVELLGLTREIMDDPSIPLCGHSFPSLEKAKEHTNELLKLLAYK